MSEAPKSMMQTIVDYYDGSIYEAADEIGVHYNTVDRLLNDETATAQAGTMEKIEAIYDEIPVEEEEIEEEEIEKKITKLEVGKTYEIRIPKSKNGNVVTLLRGMVKGEYRQFYHLDDDGRNITVLKADLVNDRTMVKEVEAVLPEEPFGEIEDAEFVPAVEEPTEEETIGEAEAPEVEAPDESEIEEPTEDTPTIIGTTPAERLHSCLFLVELCDQKIAEAEKAKRDKAAILPLMDEIYKEFRGGGFDGSSN